MLWMVTRVPWMSAQGSTATSACQFRLLDGGMSSHPTSTTEKTARNPRRVRCLLYLPTRATRLPIARIPAIQGRTTGGRFENRTASTIQPAITRRQHRIMTFPTPLNRRIIEMSVRRLGVAGAVQLFGAYVCSINLGDGIAYNSPDFVHGVICSAFNIAPFIVADGRYTL